MMSEEFDVVLTREELLILAAAVREMIKADGTISEGESDAAADLARRLEIDADQWDSIWSEAMRSIPNVDAVMHAAARVTPSTSCRKPDAARFSAIVRAPARSHRRTPRWSQSS